MTRFVLLFFVLAGAGAASWFYLQRSVATPVQPTPIALADDAILSGAKALLFAKRKDTVIGTIDVQPEAARLQGLPVEQRKELLLRTAVSRTLEQLKANDRLAGASHCRIHIIRIVNSDEYAQGDFRGMVELGTLETSPDKAGDTKASWVDRAGNVVWKPGLTQ